MTDPIRDLVTAAIDQHVKIKAAGGPLGGLTVTGLSKATDAIMLGFVRASLATLAVTDDLVALGVAGIQRRDAEGWGDEDEDQINLELAKAVLAGVMRATPLPPPANTVSAPLEPLNLVHTIKVEDLANRLEGGEVIGNTPYARECVASLRALGDHLDAIENLLQAEAVAPAVTEEAASVVTDYHAAKVAEVMDEGTGFWRACTGCQESVDGHVSTREYPRSQIFRCQPGAGCGECGGMGVIWDNIDYGAMAEAMLAEDAPDAVMAALEGFADDFMSSIEHHPDYVLFPTEKFVRICVALGVSFNNDASSAVSPAISNEGQR